MSVHTESLWLAYQGSQPCRLGWRGDASYSNDSLQRQPGWVCNTMKDMMTRNAQPELTGTDQAEIAVDAIIIKFSGKVIGGDATGLNSRY
jgi:hypothetical protein